MADISSLACFILIEHDDLSFRPRLFMHRLLPAAVLVLMVAGLVSPAAAQENHRKEAGSGVIFARSAFAHGYRHGYEAGYHEGNIDINMARSARTKIAQFRGLPLGYSPDFGPRRSFESGFQAGLRAGYSDGFAGRTFRAVHGLRSVAESLEQASPPIDPENVYFDKGVASGYQDGFGQGASQPIPSSGSNLDFHMVDCGPFHPAKQNEFSAQPSYCEGYRRGFVLGHSDGLILRPERGLLEASK